jgi:hypothetical protein
MKRAQRLQGLQLPTLADVPGKATKAKRPLVQKKTDAELLRESQQADEFQAKHFDLFKKRGWSLIECGGEGDCFFYTAAMINRVYEYPFVMRRTHLALRKQVCTYFRDHRQALLQNTTLEALLVERPKSFMTGMAAEGRYCEYEVIMMFSHMLQTPVIVWTLHDSSPLVIFPDGRMLRDRETLPETPFKIYTNGAHFQALAPTSKICFIVHSLMLL